MIIQTDIPDTLIDAVLQAIASNPERSWALTTALAGKITVEGPYRVSVSRKDIAQAILRLALTSAAADLSPDAVLQVAAYGTLLRDDWKAEQSRQIELRNRDRDI